MRRPRLLALAVTLVSGCTTVSSLERAARQHEQRAEYYATLGQGQAAARERDRATAARIEAQRREESRGGYVESELLMR